MGGKWRIVSGGQTGVDRAALDSARALGLDYGGFVPKGRGAEDGPLPDHYSAMIETASADYAVRTRRNVAAADATLILTRGAPDGGTQLTFDAACRSARPTLLVDLAADPDPVGRVREWLEGLPGGTLNVAGPRESRRAGIYAEARALLEAVLGNRRV
jgi:hypothetical protein